MILLMDCGSSRIKIATFVNNRIVIIANVLISEFLSGGYVLGIKSEPDSVCFASVLSETRTQEIINQIACLFTSSSINRIKTERYNFGVLNAYEQYQQLGIDRWLCLIAIDREESFDYCIVDAGTAITIDSLTSTGQHLGGAILPGVASMMNALSSDTDLIFDRDIIKAVYPAKGTSACIGAGVCLAVSGAITSAVYNMRQASNKEVRTIITGGNAGLVAEIFPGERIIVPDLVLRGLHKYAVSMPTER